MSGFPKSGRKRKKTSRSCQRSEIHRLMLTILRQTWRASHSRDCGVSAGHSIAFKGPCSPR